MNFDEYRDRYETVDLERDERGILRLALHTEGQPWQASREPLEELLDAFRAVALDGGNEVVILTGTGDVFSGPPSRPVTVRYDTTMWERRRSEGVALIEAYLEIPVPVIGAVNGPAYRQPHLPLLADIVLASETASFVDSAHFPNNVVPGASVGVAMMALLGLNRGRYFLLTGQELSAREALDVGLVSEVLAPAELEDRAREHAERLVEKSPLVRRYTRLLLTQELKRRVHDLCGYGMALEGLGVIDATAGFEPPATEGRAR
jgi:enoyl-CoA hydratase/carnithine racemase